MIQILNTVTCGNLTDIPSKFPRISSEIFTIIQIAVPVLLVIMGTIDMLKGITANKEDEIVKGRKMFVSRLIVGAIVFFLFVIVKTAVNFLDSDNSTNIIACMDCFLNNDCKSEAAIKAINKKEEERINYTEWTCNLNGVTFGYHKQGDSFVMSPMISGITSYDSAFVPSASNECPTSDKYVVGMDDTNFEVMTKADADKATWKCVLGEYDITYSLSGKIKYSKPNYYYTELTSEYTPEYVYACPDPMKYKVTTGARNVAPEYYIKVVKR